MPERFSVSTAKSGDCLRDHFLLAMPCLSEGIFSQSITYICEHGESGAMGIVINGDFMKMSEAREFIQGPEAKGKLLVIRPHPRSPKRVLNKIVDIAIDAGRNYELDDSPMPFVPSRSEDSD